MRMGKGGKQSVLKSKVRVYMNNLESESVRLAMVYITHEDVRKIDMYQVETLMV